MSRIRWHLARLVSPVSDSLSLFLSLSLSPPRPVFLVPYVSFLVCPYACLPSSLSRSRFASALPLPPRGFHLTSTRLYLSILSSLLRLPPSFPSPPFPPPPPPSPSGNSLLLRALRPGCSRRIW
ncbi:hypothetical protein PUN28_001672 [Cardiocondyla obscurior]|uniref:Uncharacterized protein n=1 Tax=Cardiocondyla obscurior TaxID=286306 RepID=A0AAW2GQP0_9HYME